MEIALRNGRLKGGKQRPKAPTMGAPEVVSLRSPTRTGGTIGSVFLKYVRALLILDQHDSKARVWEEGAVEVPPECCQSAVAFQAVNLKIDLSTPKAIAGIKCKSLIFKTLAFNELRKSRILNVSGWHRLQTALPVPVCCSLPV